MGHWPRVQYGLPPRVLSLLLFRPRRRACVFSSLLPPRRCVVFGSRVATLSRSHRFALRSGQMLERSSADKTPRLRRQSQLRCETPQKDEAEKARPEKARTKRPQVPGTATTAVYLGFRKSVIATPPNPAVPGAPRRSGVPRHLPLPWWCTPASTGKANHTRGVSGISASPISADAATATPQSQKQPEPVS